MPGVGGPLGFGPQDTNAAFQQATGNEGSTFQRETAFGVTIPEGLPEGGAQRLRTLAGIATAAKLSTGGQAQAVINAQLQDLLGQEQSYVARCEEHHEQPAQRELDRFASDREILIQALAACPSTHRAENAIALLAHVAPLVRQHFGRPGFAPRKDLEVKATGTYSSALTLVAAIKEKMNATESALPALEATAKRLKAQVDLLAAGPKVLLEMRVPFSARDKESTVPRFELEWPKVNPDLPHDFDVQGLLSYFFRDQIKAGIDRDLAEIYKGKLALTTAQKDAELNRLRAKLIEAETNLSAIAWSEWDKTHTWPSWMPGEMSPRAVLLIGPA